MNAAAPWQADGGCLFSPAFRGAVPFYLLTGSLSGIPSSRSFASILCLLRGPIRCVVIPRCAFKLPSLDGEHLSIVFAPQPPLW